MVSLKTDPHEEILTLVVGKMSAVAGLIFHGGLKSPKKRKPERSRGHHEMVFQRLS